MFYAKPVCRIIGWLFCYIGIAGLWVGHLGEYIYFSSQESWTALVIGILFVISARHRKRTAVFSAFCIGLALVVWSIGAFFTPEIFGTEQPLEFLVRFLAGVWACYAAIQDILVWRAQELPS